MRKALYLVLKSTPKAFETFEDLKQRGFNGTAVSSESLRKAVEYYPEEHHFFNLRDLEKHEIKESILVIFVVDKENIGELKDVIRWHTENFTNPKGFMYSFDLDDYEGNV